MTITEFLLARIAEDEAEVADSRHEASSENPHAEGSHGNYGKARGNFHEMGCYYYSAQLDPPSCDCDGWRRRSAECEAKRRIVEAYSQADDDYEACGYWPGPEDQGFLAGLETAVKFLAQPYAEHPDFDPAWRM